MSTLAGGLLTLAEVPAAVAAVLAPQTDSDPPVHIDYPDALSPPALVILYDDQMLEAPRQMGPCVLDCRFVVFVVTGRIEPGPGATDAVALVASTIVRMRDDLGTWTLLGSTGVRAWMVAGIEYLGARISYRVPVAI